MALGLLLAFGPGAATAQVPDSVSYQGTLTDENGTLVADGTHELTFRLYADSTGGMSLWQETQDVRVEDGVFSVILGKETSLYTDTLSYDQPLWLSVEVDGEGELSPRTPLTAVPYAFQAHRLDRTALEAGPGIQIQKVEQDSLLQAEPLVEDDNVLRISSPSGGGNTLDQAYDQGGPGNGSAIHAADGAVSIDGIGGLLPAQSELMYLTNTHDRAYGVNVWMGGTGNTDDGVQSLTVGEGYGLFGGVIDVATPRPIAHRGPQAAVGGHANQANVRGVAGYSQQSDGVFGLSTADPMYVNAERAGVAGESRPNVGVAGVSDSSDGVVGWMNRMGTFSDGPDGDVVAGVHGEPSSADGFVDNIAVAGTPGPYNSLGVLGWGGGKGHGIVGLPGGHEGFTTAGVWGMTRERPQNQWPPFPLDKGGPTKEMVGVLGQAHRMVGVWGESIDGDQARIGVVGTSGPQLGIAGLPSIKTGMYGHVDTGRGVHGEAETRPSSALSAIGVFGETHADGPGGLDNVGVKGFSDADNGWGVAGLAPNGPDSRGVYGEGAYGVWAVGTQKAGWFDGDIWVTGDADIQGTLTKGAGSFKIDHPQAPRKKTLSHSFVESPDMMNIYNGKVQLDEDGEAWVTLPDYFEALNKNYRYQLTAIGAPAPRLYVAQRVEDNRFKIAGGKPGMAVSWEVTGTRDDPYARKNRIQVEKRKAPEKRGTYLYPEAYGKQQEDVGNR